MNLNSVSLIQNIKSSYIYSNFNIFIFKFIFVNFYQLINFVFEKCRCNKKDNNFFIDTEKFTITSIKIPNSKVKKIKIKFPKLPSIEKMPDDKNLINEYEPIYI